MDTSVRINLTPEVEAVLREQAKAMGITLTAYCRMVIYGEAQQTPRPALRAGRKPASEAVTPGSKSASADNKAARTDLYIETPALRLPGYPHWDPNDSAGNCAPASDEAKKLMSLYPEGATATVMSFSIADAELLGLADDRMGVAVIVPTT